MQHIDDDLLALIAVEPGQPDPESAAHLEACPRCRAELDELCRVVDAARSQGPSAQLVAPPDRVWEGIESALGLRTAEREPAPPPAPRPAPLRRRVPTWLAVAAGVAVGAAGTGAAVSFIESDGPAGPGEDVVATAQLEPFGDSGTPGVAQIRETGEERVLRIRVDARTAGQGFREVWLLDAETGRLVSLGVLNGTESTFELPEGLDLSDYPVVDVSREPFDGDPAHSTDSIARGELDL
jgi:hypothetical protein